MTLTTLQKDEKKPISQSVPKVEEDEQKMNNLSMTKDSVDDEVKV